MKTASVWAITDIPPQLGYAGGFSARAHHFLRAVAARWPLDILALRPENAEWTADAFLPTGFPACHFWCPTLPAHPLNRPGVRGKLQRARHYLSDALPYMSYPRHLTDLDRYWREHEAQLALFFLPYTAHLSFQVPEGVPCIYVLEEGWERGLAWSTRHLPPPLRRWVTATEGARVRRLYRRIGRRGERFVVISDREKRWFSRDIAEERIVTIPHGLDCEYFAPLAAEQDIDIGIFGMFSAERTHEAALEFYADAASQPNEFPDTMKWAFVGKAPPPAILALSSSRVLVTGQVPDLRPYYARTKVVVVPSTYGTGVKTTVLEAWAMGRPVVATPFALTGLPARPGENVLVGNSLQELREHVRGLVASAERRERLGTAGLRTVREERSIRHLAHQFADLCAQAMRAGPPSCEPAGAAVLGATACSRD